MTAGLHLRECLAELHALEGIVKHCGERMRGRLYEAIEWQRRFEADVSHELRTPVAGLRAQLEEARLHPDGVDLDELLERTLNSVERLHAVVNDLYLLAQLQEAAQPADPVPLDLTDLLQGELARRTDRINIKFQAEQGVMVRGVAVRLRRLVCELLNNAQRHAKDLVLVQVRKLEDAAELVVADDGDGIDEADRERVFEPFTRLDAARSRAAGGSGLGLAIVRNIAAAHGGSVHVADSPAGGAAFVVRLPLLSESEVSI